MSDLIDSKPLVIGYGRTSSSKRVVDVNGVFLLTRAITSYSNSPLRSGMFSVCVVVMLSLSYGLVVEGQTEWTSCRNR